MDVSFCFLFRRVPPRKTLAVGNRATTAMYVLLIDLVVTSCVFALAGRFRNARSSYI